MHHDLKLCAPYFRAVITREKTAELRFNDRDFQKGDTAQLWEINTDKLRTGSYIMIEITHICRFACLQENWVMLSFKITSSHKEK